MQFAFCAFKRQSALFHKVVDDVEVVHIVFSEQPVTLFVTLRLDDVELTFPEEYQLCVDVKHLGHFADGVE